MKQQQAPQHPLQPTPQHPQQEPPHQNPDTNPIVSNGKNTKINFAIVFYCDMNMANSVLMFVDFKVLDHFKILDMDIWEIKRAIIGFRNESDKHKNNKKRNNLP